MFQSGHSNYCCGRCFETYAEEHGDECDPGRDDVGDSAACAAASVSSDDSDGPPPWAGFSDEDELDMTTERQAQVRQPFELSEDRAADVAMARRNWMPVGHTHENIDGVFVGAMAHLRELALGQQLERGAPEP